MKLFLMTAIGDETFGMVELLEVPDDWDVRAMYKEFMESDCESKYDSDFPGWLIKLGARIPKHLHYEYDGKWVNHPLSELNYS